MDYAKALEVMEGAAGEEGDAVDPDEFEEACKKSIEALTSCLEMGLTGE